MTMMTLDREHLTERELGAVQEMLPILREIDALEDAPYETRDRTRIRSLMTQCDELTASVSHDQRRTTLCMVALRMLRGEA